MAKGAVPGSSLDGPLTSELDDNQYSPRQARGAKRASEAGRRERAEPRKLQARARRFSVDGPRARSADRGLTSDRAALDVEAP